MDAGSFFDFDTATLQPDDQYGEEEGDQYDALNDETFGSAAVQLDWVESHEKFANLSQAQKNLTSNKDSGRKYNANILEPIEIQNLERDLSSLYARKSNESASGMDEKTLGDTLLPGRSIWSYDLPMKEQRIVSPYTVNSVRANLPNNRDFSRTFPPSPSMPHSHNIKTVLEIESEMKANQLLRQLGQNNTNLQFRNMEDNFANRFPLRHYLPISSNVRNGIMGNYANFPEQLKQRPPPNRFMMPPRSMQNLPMAVANNRQWGPASISGNIMNHRFPHVRPEIHNFPQNVSHYNRPYYNNMNNERGGYFDNPHYAQQSYRDKSKDELECEWEEWRRIRQKDSYAGLLNPKEKAWLKTIEAKQHESENPYEDDYYYVMLNLKKQKRKDQEIVRVNGMQLLADKGRDYKEYVPPMMANSLGKLQVASVNAPRKIIDLPTIHTDCSTSQAPVQKELRKKRHVMMYIEKLCNIQIELDDLERKMRGLPDCPTRDLYKTKFGQLVTKLWNAVAVSENTLHQIFNIRKGRHLMSHLLDWLDEAKLSIFFGVVFENFNNIMNEDENYLVTFWIPLDRFIANASQKHLLHLVKNLDGHLCSECNDSADILRSKKFGLSVVIALMIRGEVLWSVMEDSHEWPMFLKKAVYTLAKFYEMTAISVLPSLFITASMGHIRSQVNRCFLVDDNCKKKAIHAIVLIESVVR